MGLKITRFGFTSLRRDRRGTSAVEMAIVLPLLVGLALGISEFGRAIQHYHIVVKGVRDAARYLGRVDATCPGGGGGGSVINQTEAKNLAQYGQLTVGTPLLSYWTDPNTIAVGVTCLDNSAGANLCGISPCRQAGPVPIVTVTASVPYDDLGFLSFFGIGPLTFSVSHEQVSVGE